MSSSLTRKRTCGTTAAPWKKRVSYGDLCRVGAGSLIRWVMDLPASERVAVLVLKRPDHSCDRRLNSRVVPLVRHPKTTLTDCVKNAGLTWPRSQGRSKATVTCSSGVE